MVNSNTYRVEVAPDTDFMEGWNDPAVPNMEFMYDQESLAECEDIDGVYYATYKTWVVHTPRLWEWTDSSGEHSVEIPAGEYGFYNND
tara:strand:+ start:1869 stop:2132 length:264 start_codon:yes stop_codon:yes gene_type:complete